MLRLLGAVKDEAVTKKNKKPDQKRNKSLNFKANIQPVSKSPEIINE